MSVPFNDLGGYLLKPRIVFILIVDSPKLILYGKGGHHSEAFKLHILVRHRRYRFRRFQDIKTYDAEIMDTLYTLFGKLGISVIEQDTLFIIYGFCKPHSLFKFLLTNK